MTELVTGRVAVARHSSFHLIIALICLAIAIVGFAPTYWRGLVTGSFRGGPLVHLHAMLFYGWVIFLVTQSVLVVQRRVDRHRALGLAGIALATLLVVSGLMVSVASVLRAETAGMGREARAFVIVSWSSMAVFATLVTLAIANVAKPDRHRRLMLAATISMLGAPIGRLFLLVMNPALLNQTGVAGVPPAIVSLPPAMIGNLLFVAMLIHEKRTLGRFHPATIWAALAVVTVNLLIIPVSSTEAWDQFARWVLQVAR